MPRHPNSPGRFALLVWGARALAATVGVGCGYREPVPAFTANDARFGHMGGHGEPPSQETMCHHWTSAVVARDEHAITHASFPESDVQTACFTPVTHQGRDVTVGATPRGCGYPNEASRARLLALAAELDHLAEDASSPHHLFPCTLTPKDRAAACRQNARTLRALAKRPESYPYAAVLTPGHGLLAQNETAIASYMPADPCKAMAEGDLARLGAMPIRTARAADSLRGGAAGVVIASGGAVHSRVIEAFAMMQLLECREHIEPDRILLEPCADHTHTNLRNGGRWLVAMGARSAYLLTDDFLQSDYFQDFSGFEYLMGSVDQRSLRDWGYLIGSWRQASIGLKSGFWFTPYRFWAEPKDDLGSATCVDYP